MMREVITSEQKLIDHEKVDVVVDSTMVTLVRLTSGRDAKPKGTSDQGYCSD